MVFNTKPGPIWLESDEIKNERKNKFLRIGRNDGFMSKTEDSSTLTIKKNNFDKILKSKNILFVFIIIALVIASIILF